MDDYERMLTEIDAENAKWERALQAKLAAQRIREIREDWWWLRWLPWNWRKECP